MNSADEPLKSAVFTQSGCGMWLSVCEREVKGGRESVRMCVCVFVSAGVECVGVRQTS